jgi:Protein of unknown function (DUF1592)/Protein of unknown function (DUF1588)/Protein of unknown function (DUF1587)/Protein of unknown function (DUF1595)/Protein of unknown function (DUF1585)
MSVSVQVGKTGMQPDRLQSSGTGPTQGLFWSKIDVSWAKLPAVRTLTKEVNNYFFAATSLLALLGAVACTARLDGPQQPGGSLGPSASGTGSGSAGGAAVTPLATDPGRVTLHRLNRAEYNNSVRDLLGTSLTPADDFPIDDRGSGFDNMADVLTLSPLHLNVYHDAASALVTEALSNGAERAALITCDIAAQGDACVRQILKSFAYRAWRRPIVDAELDRLLAVANVASTNGDSAETGLGLALRAVLLSPHFTFRVELDPDPASLAPHPLNAYELASRLSYFLWSSTPDGALLASAESGALTNPETIRAQTARLLQDARAHSIIDNFAGQWLHLRAVDTLQPDPTLFPQVDSALLAGMRAETELMFQDIAFQGAPLVQLLTANYSYLNDRLATHYGLPSVGSTSLIRVDLNGNLQRGGLLTQASFLTLSSHVNRTSPVVRGKWILDELLCQSPPPPPPNVNLAGIAMAKEQGLTQRQALAMHRQDPTCNSCHSLMDPIGLGLENYDAIGQYRDMDDGKPIDAAGQLPSGETFSGAKELGARIAAKPEFARCAAQKLYTYALGRPPVSAAEHLDGPTLDALVDALSQHNFSFTELTNRIVTSPTFTSRRGEPSGGMP